MLDLTITGTHITYYHLCHRKLWLFANGVHMEHTSEAVAEGRLIGETTYSGRATKFTEIEVDGIKIDFYDSRNKVIHEVKKSSRVEYAHVAQVKYYIFKLRRSGVEGVTGVIEYPKLKQRREVSYDTCDDDEIVSWENAVREIISREQCPAVIRARICKSCSYFDFCYSDEVP